MNRKVIYTCIVDGYDDLRQPLAVDPGFDYICFSNDFQQIKVGVWEIRPIPYSSTDKTRLSRFVKLMPHKALPEYEISVWMDANVQIIGPGFYAAVERAVDAGHLLSQVPHPYFDCVYDDMRAISIMARVPFFKVYRQYRYLRKEGFPEHFGMFENNIIFRVHNDPSVVSISEEWWKVYNEYTPRDQFSLMYLYWKRGMKVPLLFGESLNARNVPFLAFRKHDAVSRNKEIKGIRRFFMKIDWTVVRWLTKLLLA
ncbi:MAG: DUF616 domain-containing protein [Bacteroidales bacterium]|nr:DUF616 domain-containing protein [Bacteroidales bacterium]